MPDRIKTPDHAVVQGRHPVVQALRRWSAAALSIGRAGRPQPVAEAGQAWPDRVRMTPAAMVARLAEASTDAVVLCHADGLIQSVNAAGLRLFGQPLQALLHRPLARLVPGCSLADTAARAHADGDLVCQGDGSLVAMRVAVARLVSGDQVFDCVQLRPLNTAAQRAPRNPVSPIANSAPRNHLVAQTHALQELSADAVDSLGRLDFAQINPTNTELLKLLKQQVQAMTSFAGHLAELATLDAPGHVPEQAPFDVRRLLAPLMSGFAARARERDLALELCWNLPSRMVMGDADHVADLVRHLFHAAMADMQGGSLLIQIGARLTDTMQAGGELTIAVEADCGGYEAGLLLDRHRRLAATAQDPTGNSTPPDMDLYLAHRLTLAMGGTLSASARNGGGVALRASLGAGLFLGGEPLVERGRLAGATSVRSEGLHVLVVDDNRVNQRLLERWLQRDGMQVHCVTDGQSAVRAVREHVFDVILMDVSMPVMNGMEATTAIRALGLLPVQPVLSALRVPIIGVSAHAMAGDREACITAGMDDYITKPVQRDILLTKIAKYVV
ncbi:MAG: response regulator [Aquabacterium sp.]|nr:response regulator [Aquabacterium sp.]